MRRGLLKDLANTPTAIACGWRLYSDIEALTILEGKTLSIDLFSGAVMVGEDVSSRPLGIADALSGWFRERIEKDRVPDGMVISATLELQPQAVGGLRVACHTVVQAEIGTFESRDIARWASGA